jgi:hypothetical protein
MLPEQFLVPKKGLEPPHPCEYMDLNHARLPIPPLRHSKIQRVLDGQQWLVSQGGGRMSILPTAGSFGQGSIVLACRLRLYMHAHAA